MCVRLAKVTKFSRYNESSDSDTSDSESSSTDSDADTADDNTDASHLASPGDDSAPTDATVAAGVGLSSADSADAVNESSVDNSVEHLATQNTSDTEGPKVSSEQVDALAKDSVAERPRSPSQASHSSSLSSNDTPPTSPIRSPLRLEAPGHSLTRGDFPRGKDVAEFRRRGQVNRRRPSVRSRQYDASTSYSQHHVQSGVGRERPPLRTSDSLQSSPVKHFSSTSDSARPVSKTSSPYQCSAVYANKTSTSYSSRPVSQERQPPKSGSERASLSPLGSPQSDTDDRRQCSSRVEYSPQPRSRLGGKSPDRKPPVWRNSPERNLPRLSRSRSSSRSRGHSGGNSRSRSGGRFVGSPSRSRSHSPVGDRLFRRQRSESLERGSKLPMSSSARHMVSSVSGSQLHDKPPARYMQEADSYKDGRRRRSSRSLSTERVSETRYPHDLSPPLTADSLRPSVKTSPYRRSYSRSPDRMDRSADTKPSASREFLEKPQSRSSSRHGSQSPRLSDRRSPHQPSQRGRNQVNDRRQDSARYRLGRSKAKPQGNIFGRLPDGRDRLNLQPSAVRKRSVSTDRISDLRKRLPDNRPSVQDSLVSQRHREYSGSAARLPQTTDDVMRSHARSRFSPPPPDSTSTDTRSQHNSRRRPDHLKPEYPAKSTDEPRAPARNNYNGSSADSQITHPGTSAEQPVDSSAVEKRKKSTELDKSVEQKSCNEWSTSACRESIHTQVAQRDEGTKGQSTSSVAGRVKSHGALTLKRPTAPAAAVLAARKQRFKERQISEDSRSVCIRSDSKTTSDRRAKHGKQSLPALLDRTRELGKRLKDVAEKRKIAKKSTQRRKEGKLRTETSEVSDLTSADSSMSLEDISEDETPQVRDNRFTERSDSPVIQHRSEHASRLGEQDVQGQADDDDDDDDDVGRKSSAVVSSVVKPVVKKDVGISEPQRSVGRHGRSTVSEAQSTTPDDDILVNAPRRNIISKGL